MPVVGLGTIRAKTKALALNIEQQRVPRAITAGAMVGQAYAQMLTPIDTSNLINSQYRRLSKLGGMGIWRASVGYTAAYAAAVHEASGKLKGQPRANFGKTKSGQEFGGGTGVGNYWDPDAEPGFLRKGFDDHRPEIEKAIKRGLRL